MKIKTRLFKCDNSCIANNGGYCMWKINKKLMEKAKDKKYRDGMCQFLKEEVEKYIYKWFLFICRKTNKK